MSNTNGKKPGISMRVSNPPNRNGNGDEWENFGNIYFDSAEGRGTLYFKASVDQLKKLIKGAKDGQVEKKIGIRISKPKASTQGSGVPMSAEAEVPF